LIDLSRVSVGTVMEIAQNVAQTIFGQD
jgi:hypothetical protein